MPDEPREGCADGSQEDVVALLHVHAQRPGHLSESAVAGLSSPQAGRAVAGAGADLGVDAPLGSNSPGPRSDRILDVHVEDDLQ
eukprot:4621469-Alexandrium_andersonii.AAC.1